LKRLTLLASYRELASSILISLAGESKWRSSRTSSATPVASHVNWRHSAELSEFEPLFLNGTQRSVNRKVQGSNPCSGAKTDFMSRQRERSGGIAFDDLSNLDLGLSDSSATDSEEFRA
jgi:hypothetical protein